MKLKEIYIATTNDYGFGQYSERQSKNFNRKYISADIVEEISQKIEMAISDLVSLDSQQALVQLESIPTLKKYLEDK